MGPRLGMLGGTYDPVHIGHGVVAQDVVEELELDRLLVVPAGRPPHREAVLPAPARYEITRRVFAGDDRIDVCDLELRREGPSYTVDTLARIREELDPETLFCVIGIDQLRELDTWHRPERIPELAQLVVMSRGGEEPSPDDAPLDLPYRTLRVTRVDLSSTRVRRRLRAGETVRYLVPDSVRERVEEAWARAAPDDPSRVRG